MARGLLVAIWTSAVLAAGEDGQSHRCEEPLRTASGPGRPVPGSLALQHRRAESFAADLVEDGTALEEDGAALEEEDEGLRKGKWWWHRRRTPSPSHPYFIQFNARDETPVPRKELDGLATEVLVRYPLSQVRLSANGTKVHIPFGKWFETNFSRDSSANRFTDFGVYKAMAFKSNPQSMISEKVGLSFLEKTHSMYSPVTDFPTFTRDKAELDKKTRGWFDNWRAKNPIAIRTRNLLMHTFIAESLRQQIRDNSVRDSAFLWAVRDFAKSNDAKPSSREREVIANASQRLRERAAKASSKVLRSVDACMHFETTDGMVIEKDGADIPLDTRIVAFRGHVMASPNEEYDFATGYAVLHHNEEADSVDLYFAGSHVLAASATKAGYEAAVWVSHPDGASWPKPSEGRPSSMPAMWAAREAYDRSQRIPLDYTFLHKSREEAGCTQELLLQLEEASWQAEKSLGPTLGKDGVKAMTLLSETVPCAVEFLRPGGHASGYDMFAALGFSHFAMEIPPPLVVELLAAHAEWNSVNGVEASYAATSWPSTGP